MIRVNLLSPSADTPATAHASLFGRISLPPVILAASLLGTIGWWAALVHVRAELNAQITAREQLMAEMQPVPQRLERAKARVKQLEDGLAAIAQIQRAGGDTSELLRAIARSLPPDVWLLELKHAGPLVQFDGRALSMEAIAAFVESLRATGAFDAAPEIRAAAAERTGDLTIFRFSAQGRPVMARPGGR